MSQSQVLWKPLNTFNLRYTLITVMTIDVSHPFLMLGFPTIPSLSTDLGLSENTNWNNSSLAWLKKMRTNSEEIFSWWSRRGIVALFTQVGYVLHTLTAPVMTSSKWSSPVLVNRDAFFAMLKKMQVCICVLEGSNGVVNKWYLGMGIEGREIGWRKKNNKKKNKK